MNIESTITIGQSKDGLIENPIQSGWILEGQPVARAVKLSVSADGTASTYFWDCTAGRFNWFYSFDETFHILEGEVTLKGPSGKERHVTVGDTVFFPAGASAEWTVQRYVRKIAFCRTPLPASLVRLRDAARSLRRMLRPGSAAEPGGGLL